MKKIGILWVGSFICIIIAMSVNSFWLLLSTKHAFESHKKVKDVTDAWKEEVGFWSFRNKEVEKLIDSLKQKNELLTQKESEFKKLENYVKAEIKELEKTKIEIENIRKNLSDAILEIEASELKNMKEVATTYENLPPQTIINIFKKFDDVFVLKILLNMNNELVANIFQAMVDDTENEEFSIKRVSKLTKMMRLVTQSKNLKN